jgi:hypothetical protein
MICREGLEEKERVVQAGFEKLESSGNPASKKAAEGLAVEILDPYRTMDQRLSELPPPQKDRMAIKRMIRQLEAGLQEAEQDPGTVVEGNPFLTAHESAKAYGLKACAF